MKKILLMFGILMPTLSIGATDAEQKALEFALQKECKARTMSIIGNRKIVDARAHYYKSRISSVTLELENPKKSKFFSDYQVSCRVYENKISSDPVSEAAKRKAEIEASKKAEAERKARAKALN